MLVMETDGANLRDRLALSELCARFSDAANRKDADAFAALWLEGATWTIGPPVDSRFEGRDEIVAAFTDLVGRHWDYFIQLPTAAHVVEVERDEAMGRQYVVELGQAKEGPGNFNVSVYRDVMQRTADGWRFQSREYETLYFDDRPLKGRALVDRHGARTSLADRRGAG